MSGTSPNASNSHVVTRSNYSTLTNPSRIGNLDKRSYNAVVRGHPESSSTLSSVRLAGDKKSLSDLTRNLSLSLPSELKLFRLGSKNAIKPRLLKVIFTSTELALRFVSDFNTEKRSKSTLDQASSISIARDRTLLGRKESHRIYSNLDERRKKGEHNIAVRYRNGAPYLSQIRLASKADDLHSQQMSGMHSKN
ncbi:Hypothetical protein CINCED_3A025929 [Cinara cedri]|uniref:Uncharacterized protein n=1 Tax=Cinara cedri TaxID=506608 RepID=A0A5E4NA35_9HEMI|nr:Hypothetical protein CINCED_3A025929 [Cinara cedri]